MATVRMAGGALLGTVTDTASAVSSVVNTVAGGASILNDMVNNVKIKRRESNLVEMISFRDNLINDASVDAVRREENIRNFIGNDEGKIQSFQKFHNKLTTAFDLFDKQNSSTEE